MASIYLLHYLRICLRCAVIYQKHSGYAIEMLNNEVDFGENGRLNRSLSS
jgi:hypothetical protein